MECEEMANLAEIYDDKDIFQLNTAHMSVRTRKVRLQFYQKCILSQKKKKKEGHGLTVLKAAIFFTITSMSSWSSSSVSSLTLSSGAWPAGQ